MIEKIYVETKKGVLYHPSLCSAHYGFVEFFDCDVEFYPASNPSSIYPKVKPETEVIVGGVKAIRDFFKFAGIPQPPSYDYPNE